MTAWATSSCRTRFATQEQRRIDQRDAGRPGLQRAIGADSREWSRNRSLQRVARVQPFTDTARRMQGDHTARDCPPATSAAPGVEQKWLAP